MKMATSFKKTIDENSCLTKIVIVGAGIAGISAANHLLENKEKDFLIVEARSRIGGRIVSTNIGKKKVELGANWIHGILGNPIFEIAVANDLLKITNIPKPHRIIAATENGKQVPFAILEEIYSAYLCFLKKCEEYFISSYSPPEGIHSVGEHIALEISLYLSSLPSQNRKVRQLLFDCLLKRETCITGCNNMNEIDLFEMGSYTELQGGNITIPEGYSSILEVLTKHIPKEKILMEHTVNKIRWFLEHGSALEDYKDLIKIECDNGKVIYCEHVICTLPLGVLKERATDIFEPLLNVQKLQAIENLMFGTVDKIILEYDRPFLNSDISEIMLLWDDCSIVDKEKTNISKTWFRKIYSFIKLSDTLLLGWISGKAAIYMESLSNNEVAQVCTDILRIFLNDPFIPMPKTCLCTKWYSQTFTRGSYTAMAVGSTQADIEIIAKPLYKINSTSDLKIAFAGEHTHSSFYSTVHGAYLSGRTAAQSILESKHSEHRNTLECSNTSDLSSWIRGIQLD